tara:strand:- start:1583 stop:1900 length:318 start_codon:yes stop_codon:yes gene_type:complete
MSIIDKWTILNTTSGILVMFILSSTQLKIENQIIVAIVIQQLYEYFKTTDYVVEWMLKNNIVQPRSVDEPEWYKYKGNGPINSASETLFFCLGILIYISIKENEK